MRRLLIAVSVLFAIASHASAGTPPAAAVAVIDDAIVVAHDRKIDVFDLTGTQLRWSTDGVALASTAIAADGRAAVIDSLNNDVRLLDLQNRVATTIVTGETPVAALFDGPHLLVLERDAAQLTRYDANGRRDRSVALAADSAFLRRAGGMVYVYSRGEGVVQEIDPPRFEVTRRITLAPAASDFEIDARNGYLAYPREAKVRTFSRETFGATGEMSVGAVPVDIDLAGAPNALSARRLAVADPSSKRLWVVEGRQSMTEAFLRGFLRGFLGLGGASRNSSFPTGVDRAVSAGSKVFAYDTSSGTLYRVAGKKATAVARGVPSAGFAESGDGLAVWSEGRLRLVR
ncbi:MAG: hypothetical protein WA208_15910 [Thermoanaerobaculia bacterium]